MRYHEPEDAAARIAALDAVADCQEIAYLLYAREFAWDIERALEFALFRTYAVPAISGLLARTGEFERRPRKRYDDTELILAEIIENGFDSERGTAALARMNAMHGRFRIEGGDMLYLLSTFVFEPIRWLGRFGRRPMTAHEAEAWFRYHRGLGARMGIAGIPDEREAFRRFNEGYEAERFRYADSNRAVAAATSDMLIGFYLPSWLVPAELSGRLPDRGDRHLRSGRARRVRGPQKTHAGPRRAEGASAPFRVAAWCPTRLRAPGRAAGGSGSAAFAAVRPGARGAGSQGAGHARHEVVAGRPGDRHAGQRRAGCAEPGGGLAAVFVGQRVAAAGGEVGIRAETERLVALAPGPGADHGLGGDACVPELAHRGAAGA